MKVQGPLDLNSVGVLKCLADPLAAAGISLYAVSTFDTDYVLVRDGDLAKAIATFEANGFVVEGKTADGEGS
jgi:hypothetical protein